MHRTDGDANVGGLFTEGDPAMGQAATQVTDAWLNDVQEEICNVITDAGIALVKGTRTQLRDAIAVKIAGLEAALKATTGTLLGAAGGSWSIGSSGAVRDAFGMVRLGGSVQVTGPGVTAEQVQSDIAVLPVGFRPGVDTSAKALMREWGTDIGPFKDSSVLLKVSGAGVVTVDLNTALTHTYRVQILLDNITFRIS